MPNLVVIPGKADSSYPKVSGYVVEWEANVIIPAKDYVLVGDRTMNPHTQKSFKVGLEFFYKLDGAFKVLIDRQKRVLLLAQAKLDSLVACYERQKEKEV